MQLQTRGLDRDFIRYSRVIVMILNVCVITINHNGLEKRFRTKLGLRIAFRNSDPARKKKCGQTIS